MALGQLIDVVDDFERVLPVLRSRFPTGTKPRSSFLHRAQGILPRESNGEDIDFGCNAVHWVR